jgi:hypothetical protein
MLSDRLGIPVKMNQYDEGTDDVIFIFECPSKPPAQEVDLTIKVGLCSEHDDFSVDTLIDENGDVFQELVDLLLEEYTSNAETDESQNGE